MTNRIIYKIDQYLWMDATDGLSPDRKSSNKDAVVINGPPDDGKCNICGRHVSELDAFGGAGDPLLGDFSGMKLVKQFREDHPDEVTVSWECRDCILKPGGMFVFHTHNRLFNLNFKEIEETFVMLSVLPQWIMWSSLRSPYSLAHTLN